MGVDGGIRGASGSLTGENFKPCGKGVCLSQEPCGSSHQAASEHISFRLARHLTAYPHSLHPGHPSGSTSCFNHAPDECCPSTAYSDKYHLSGGMTGLSGDSAVRCGEDIQLSWFTTVALSTAHSSLKQKVRTKWSQGSPWLPISEARKLELCLPEGPNIQASSRG